MKLIKTFDILSMLTCESLINLSKINTTQKLNTNVCDSRTNFELLTKSERDEKYAIREGIFNFLLHLRTVFFIDVLRKISLKLIT